MKTRFLAVLALLGAFVMTAAAADVTGKWVAEVPGRQGNTMTSTFDLKADGSALTGSVTTPRGEMPIQDGKVDGKNVSFSQTMKMQDNEIKLVYKGVVDGDQIKFTRTREGADRTQEFVAKRAN
jgi:hypothetical protein